MIKASYETYATIRCVVAGQRLAAGVPPYTAGNDHRAPQPGCQYRLRERVGKGRLAGSWILPDSSFFAPTVVQMQGSCRAQQPDVKDALSELE